MKIQPWIKYAAKAVYAGIVTFLGGVATAILAEDGGTPEITWQEWITIATLVVTTVGGVFGLTNGSRPSKSPPDTP